MLKLLGEIPVLGTFVIKPVLTAEEFVVDRAIDAVNLLRVLLGL